MYPKIQTLPSKPLLGKRLRMSFSNNRDVLVEIDLGQLFEH